MLNRVRDIKYVKIKVRMRKLWSREHKLLFQETSIYMIFIFEKLPFSGKPILSLQPRLSLSLFIVAADFRRRYLTPPTIKLVLCSSSPRALQSHTNFLHQILV